MTSDFEQPTAQDVPTRIGTDVPWKKRFDYKSGKTPQGFADDAIPEKVNAGFLITTKKPGQNSKSETLRLQLSLSRSVYLAQFQTESIMSTTFKPRI